MRTKVLAVSGSVVVLLLLTACGGGAEGRGAADTEATASAGAGDARGPAGAESRKTGPEVAEDAADALEEAGTVHVRGTIDATVLGGLAYGLDLHLDGADLSGTVEIAGHPLQLLRSGGTLYVQAPAAFWTAAGFSAARAAEIDGVWVLPPAGLVQQFSGLSLGTLADSLRNPADTTFQVEVTTDELGGRPVVVVSDGAGSSVSVVDDAPAYPLQEEFISSEVAVMITFDGFGEQPTITPPPAPVDISTGV